jgi:hypothetical protein
MAQLPSLMFEQKPPMSSDDFKTLAESLLNEADAGLLEHLSIDPDPQAAENPAYAEHAPSTGCSFIDGWHEWERTFRLNLAKHRAVHLKREGTGAVEPPFVPADAAAAASKAIAGESSPLDAEILIDKARWNAIENLEGNVCFHRNNIFAYYLKLLLLERRQAFNTDRGFSEYKSLYSEIIEKSPGEPK